MDPRQNPTPAEEGHAGHSGWQHRWRLSRLANVGQEMFDHRRLNDEGDDPHGLATPRAS